MVIKKSSRIFRYLSWLDKVYESKLIESKSLCPLFWKTIIMTLFLPIFLPFIGLINLAKIVIDKYISKMLVPNYIKLGLEMILFCCLTAWICFVVCFLLYYLITDFINTITCIGFGMLIGLAIVSPILACEITKKIFTKVGNIQVKAKDTSVKDFVVEGISSIKNRVCPLIIFQEDLGVFETAPVYKELIQTLLQRIGYYDSICGLLNTEYFEDYFPEESRNLQCAIMHSINTNQNSSRYLFGASTSEVRIRFLNNLIQVLDTTPFKSIWVSVEVAYQLTKAQLHQGGEENT